MKNIRFCPNCYNGEVAEGICPVCGFDPNGEIVLSHTLPVGTKLADRYFVGKVLGEGGFGITYVGFDTRLELKLAIKEYYPVGYANREHTEKTHSVYSYIGDKTEVFEKGMDRFIKEARRLSKFAKEPGIVTVTDFFTENNTAYIIMEYVEGNSLKDVLAQHGKVAEKSVLEMLEPIIITLDKMHKAGIIHRDIAPDNIMLEPNGKAKLIDFGAASEVTTANGKSTIAMIKSGFAPEEQYDNNHNRQGTWTDVYGICATMYAAIEGVTPPDAIARLRGEPLVPMSGDVSPATRTAIENGLIMTAEKRTQTMAQLLSELHGENLKAAAITPTVPVEPVSVTMPVEPASITLPVEPASVTLPVEPASVTLPVEPVSAVKPVDAVSAVESDSVAPTSSVKSVSLFAKIAKSFSKLTPSTILAGSAVAAAVAICIAVPIIISNGSSSAIDTMNEEDTVSISASDTTIADREGANASGFWDTAYSENPDMKIAEQEDANASGFWDTAYTEATVTTTPQPDYNEFESGSTATTTVRNQDSPEAVVTTTRYPTTTVRGTTTARTTTIRGTTTARQNTTTRATTRYNSTTTKAATTTAPRAAVTTAPTTKTTARVTTAPTTTKATTTAATTTVYVPKDIEDIPVIPIENFESETTTTKKVDPVSAETATTTTTKFDLVSALRDSDRTEGSTIFSYSGTDPVEFHYDNGTTVLIIGEP
jgi:serine/threonine protein kinase